MAPSAIGANKMSIFRYREVIKLAAAVARNPIPRIRNERRTPARLTKKPALALMATIRSRPSHGCGACRGTSPGLTFTTKADCRGSIKPASQTAHVATPAKKARPSETSSDFHESVFNALVISGGDVFWSWEAAPDCQRDYTLTRGVRHHKKQ